jgi:flagellar biosynthetic protein FlhB
MAGQEERTEQATPRRRQEAREKGQVAKSMEVNAAASLLAIYAGLKALGPQVVASWVNYATLQFREAGTTVLTPEAMQVLLRAAGGTYLACTMPMLAVILAAGVGVNMVQTGVILSSQPLAFDFSRLNPIQGIGRMFSLRALMEMVKAAVKAVCLGYIIYDFFKARAGAILGLISQSPLQIGPSLVTLVMDLLLRAVVMLVVLAVADYAFQRWQFEKNLRMTKQEVKEEYKRTEGDPLIKMRLRQRARELARSRMMADVARATVVVTNPTHIAVALRYEPGVTPAPRVLAMGQRLMAERIKAMARTHHVPIVENKPLARTLFAQCDVGDYIPPALYQAVAEIIAFVYRQSGRSM